MKLNNLARRSQRSEKTSTRLGMNPQKKVVNVMSEKKHTVSPEAELVVLAEKVGPAAFNGVVVAQERRVTTL